MDMGLLSWNSLLQKLLISTFKEELSQDTEASTVLASLFNQVFQPTPLIAGRYLNNFYRSETVPFAFENAVRNALYQNLEENKESSILLEIRKLCLAVGKSPNLRGIITYNFDDLIEQDLEKSGSDIKFRSIFAPGNHPDDDELPIYHVHGFLPHKANIDSKNKIVFSENFYHDQYTNVYDWSNLIQIEMFSKSCCLLVGTSLTDPNQRRLLDIAKTIRGDDKIHHYCIRKKHSTSSVGSALKRLLNEDNKLLEEKDKAKLNFDKTVKDLIKVMQIYEEKDAASFGVGTIWVEEYPDAANVLRELRRGEPR